MARSVSQATRLGAALVNVAEASSLIPLQRRGYGAASDVSVRGGLSKIRCMCMEENMKAVTTDWAPDPVTGYYRPISHAPESDPVELRNMLLNHKLTSSSSSSN